LLSVSSSGDLKSSPNFLADNLSETMNDTFTTTIIKTNQKIAETGMSFDNIIENNKNGM
jgi:hypothetical protein